MTHFSFFTQLKNLGFRLPIICYSSPCETDREIIRLSAYLDLHNISHDVFDSSSHTQMHNQIKSLGSETKHVIVNASKGIHLKGFFALTAKLCSGSLFFLFIPPREMAHTLNDNSSEAWFNFTYQDFSPIISAPLFTTFLHYCIDKLEKSLQIDCSDFNWESLPNCIERLFINEKFDHASLIQSSPSAGLTFEQQQAFENIIYSNKKINLLSAKRGRGKSHTLKYLIEHLTKDNKRLWLTGVRKSLYQGTTIDPRFAISPFFLAPEKLDEKVAFLSLSSSLSILADWLIIDEAATIPFSSLKKWIPYFHQILLVSTLDGYEGSGQALNFKLQAIHSQINQITLLSPIRFNQRCPLNIFTELLMVADSFDKSTLFSNAYQELIFHDRLRTVLNSNLDDLDKLDGIEVPPQRELKNTLDKFTSVTHSHFYTKQHNTSSSLKGLMTWSFTHFDQFSLNLAKAVYYFFKHIHYQTSPNDLRRILDGQNQYFFILSKAPYTLRESSANKETYTQAVTSKNKNLFTPSTFVTDEQNTQHIVDVKPDDLPIKAAAWLLLEGGAQPTLAKQIWIGKRRPKANLIAQSLATHANNALFPTLKGIRISRIGVLPKYRRSGLASDIIKKIIDKGKLTHLDYVSVSFGLENELLTFWLAQGFKAVHLSHRADASSGQPSLMMLYPLSAKGLAETHNCLNDFKYQRKVYFNLSNQYPQNVIFVHQSQLLNFIYTQQSSFQDNALPLPSQPTQRFESNFVYCLCAFAFHHKTFLAILPAFFDMMSNNKANIPDNLRHFWAQYTQSGLPPTKGQTQLLRMTLRSFLEKHHPEDVINYNDWLSS